MTNLTDNERLRAHPQRIPDQVPQTDLASALEARLPGLHTDDVGQRDLQRSPALYRTAGAGTDAENAPLSAVTTTRAAWLAGFVGLGTLATHKS